MSCDQGWIDSGSASLIKNLQDEPGMTYLFLAGDLSMVKYISDRIGPMHSGKRGKRGKRIWR